MQAVGYSASLSDDSIDHDNLLQYVTPKDLKDFGLIPEIIGRLPVLTYMNPLDSKALRSILTEPKNAIVKQYEKLFEMDNIELQFTDGALDFVVEKALEYKLGTEDYVLCVKHDQPCLNTKPTKVLVDVFAMSRLNKVAVKKLKAVS